jgi:hypothetical protein
MTFRSFSFLQHSFLLRPRALDIGVQYSFFWSRVPSYPTCTDYNGFVLKQLHPKVSNQMLT